MRTPSNLIRVVQFAMYGAAAAIAGGILAPRLTVVGRAKAAVRAELREPDAARFSHVRRISSTRVCGMVSGANATGGRTMDLAFTVDHGVPHLWVQSDAGDAATYAYMCGSSPAAAPRR
jgi:hypothetical protein